MGRPSSILREAGVLDKEIKIEGSKIEKKLREHGFFLSELRNLPIAIADPIMVFDNESPKRQGGASYNKGHRSILTEMKTRRGNVLVALELDRNNTSLNIITTMFGVNKDSLENWMRKGCVTYYNEKKDTGCSYRTSSVNGWRR
ncbi:MAG: hypothetical protein MJZ73_08705 [Bacteroidaceae bacterium]|nr:hypothetical protein [Bacteroidaceae bacterium]